MERRIDAAERAYRRHVLWTVLGLSPGALVPLLYALSEWGGGALVTVVFIVCISESVRALGARREMRRLEGLALELRTELEALSR